MGLSDPGANASSLAIALDLRNDSTVAPLLGAKPAGAPNNPDPNGPGYPVYVQAVIDAAVGRATSVDIGHMRELLMAMGLGYSLGGLLFGIALYRAGILARWACVLLAYGTTPLSRSPHCRSPSAGPSRCPPGSR